MPLSFDNVSEAPDRSMTMPGTIGVFSIEKVEFGFSDNKGTKYMEVTFADETTSFRHSFYVTEKALSRIQTLAIATGDRLTGSPEDAALIARFTRKKMALKVTGRVGTNGKGYPDLPFGGFAKPVDKLNELKFSPQEEALIAEARQAIMDSSLANADSERPQGSGQPAPTGDGADF